MRRKSVEKQYLHIKKGAKKAEVLLKVNKQAKKITIKVDNTKKKIELVLPPRANLCKAEEFLLSKQDWIWEYVSRWRANICYQAGVLLPVLGREVEIVHGGALRGLSILQDDILTVFGLEEHLPRKVEEFLYTHLSQFIGGIARNFAKKMGVEYNKLTIRDMKSKWGSCNSNKNLSFGFRLVFAPEAVVRYVVIHEMCHLVEMNHSARFWKLVANLDPNYRDSINWLRKNGNQLYSYGNRVS